MKRIFFSLLFFSMLIAACGQVPLKSRMVGFNEGRSKPHHVKVQHPIKEVQITNQEARRRPMSWREPLSKAEINRLPTLMKQNWKTYKLGKPYRIRDKWYYPEEDRDFVETGIASWYGAQFHNRLTANGEIFDKNEVSAAHLTLPMPSMVRVTNLENGLSLLVRVNDRGPFKNNRVIDLSERAARKLGLYRKGIARVKVEFDEKETAKLFYDAPVMNVIPKPKPLRAKHNTSPKPQRLTSVEPGKEYYIQTGSYNSYDNAKRIHEKLYDVANAVAIQEGEFRGKIVYRVKVGPYNNLEQAGSALDQIANLGFSDAVIIKN